jgi:hypothetical protein
MKRHWMAAAVFGMLGQAALAEGLSFSGDIALGRWENTLGGSGLSNNGGIDAAIGRETGRVNLSAARDFGAMTGEIAFAYQGYGRAPSSADTDDATKHHMDLALRGGRDFGAFSLGAFLGQGRQDDYGDSDLPMTYRIEAATTLGRAEVFGQIGTFDSADEFDEGTQNARFLRLGLDYAVGEQTSVSGAVSTAQGDKYGPGGFDSKTLALELGVTHRFADSGLSTFANYEWVEISHLDSGTDYGDRFGTVMLGVKFDLGAKAGHGKRLPNIGQWVSHNANEVE